MNLEIHNFTKNNKIKKNYICKLHGGNSISPKISWNEILDAKSYSLIFEDPDAVGRNFVHWYIPYIDPKIILIDKLKSIDIYIDPEKINLKDINNIKILHGLNSINKYGYHGPCAPKNTGNHRYILTLFALNNKVLNKMKISGSSEFRDFLDSNNILILKEQTLEYKYGYKDYFV